MPRKRTTRAQKKRADPELKDSDESENGLSAKERKEKLERYLSDFDMQVEATLKKFKSDEVVLKRINRKHFNSILMKFSARQRKMTVRDYYDELEESEMENDEETEETESVDQLSEAAPLRHTPGHQLLQKPVYDSEKFEKHCQTLSKYRSQSRRMIDPIPEEGGVVTTTQKKTGKVTRTGQGVTFGAAPSTAPRNSRFVTPLNQRNLSAIGMNTPLITPKFDPRLPITPAQKRQPRAGETYVSLAGSPIHGPKERTITLPVPEGAEFDELLDEYSVLDELEITASTKSQMSKIAHVLTTIIKAQRQIEKKS